MNAKFFFVPILPLLFALSLPLQLCGCSSAPSNGELQVKVQELESQNASLKSELTILKSAFADAKVQKLQQALQPAAGPTGLADDAASVRRGVQAGSSDESSPKFTDLDETPTKEMILGLAKLHVFDGKTDKFEPTKAITRGEYAEWLFKAYNALEPEAKQLRLAPQVAQIFKDTPSTQRQYKYVQALANAGYSIGYDDGTFRPDQPLTREEMLSIKVGLDVGKTLAPWRSQMDNVWKFSDGKAVNERFTGYVHQDFYVSGPHGSNIQRAFGKIGALRPKQSVLRSEAAATLWQVGQFGDTQNTNVAAVLKSKGDTF
ncbi:hypothetical protein BH10CYA1_BH10CYA1_61240 [soil metagenome]